MSSDLRIIGFKPPTEKWKKMKAVWDSCTEAHIGIPDEVIEFFDGEEPSENGVALDMKELGKSVTEWSDADQMGYEVDLDQLPKDIKILRFYLSY